MKRKNIIARIQISKIICLFLITNYYLLLSSAFKLFAILNKIPFQFNQLLPKSRISFILFKHA